MYACAFARVCVHDMHAGCCEVRLGKRSDERQSAEDVEPSQPSPTPSKSEPVRPKPPAWPSCKEAGEMPRQGSRARRGDPSVSGWFSGVKLSKTLHPVRLGQARGTIAFTTAAPD